MIPSASHIATASTPASVSLPPVPSSADPSASMVRRKCVNEAIRTPSRCSDAKRATSVPTASHPSSARTNAISSVGERGVDVRTGQADAHRVRVLRCDTPPGLQHPQRLAQRALGTEVVVDEDREHLDVDAARAQPGQPDMSEVRALLGRLPAHTEHEQVVVRVDDDRRSWSAAAAAEMSGMTGSVHSCVTRAGWRTIAA